MGRGLRYVLMFSLLFAFLIMPPSVSAVGCPEPAMDQVWCPRSCTLISVFDDCGSQPVACNAPAWEFEDLCYFKDMCDLITNCVCAQISATRPSSYNVYLGNCVYNRVYSCTNNGWVRTSYDSEPMDDGDACTIDGACTATGVSRTAVAPICPAASTVNCGAAITPTNGCGSCSGTGTYCADGSDCTGGVCQGLADVVDIDIYVDQYGNDDNSGTSKPGDRGPLSNGENMNVFMTCDGYANVWCEITNKVSPTASMDGSPCTQYATSGSDWVGFKCGTASGKFPCCQGHTITCSDSGDSMSSSFGINSDPDGCPVYCASQGGTWASTSASYIAGLGTSQRKNCCGDNNNRVWVDANNEYVTDLREQRDADVAFEYDGGAIWCCNDATDCICRSLKGTLSSNTTLPPINWSNTSAPSVTRRR